MRKNLLVHSPIESEKMHVGKPKQSAAGLPALFSSLKHIRKEMNLKTCASTLLAANQMEGFDCPGCAWPDPDDHRSKLGEYCENGVKAISEEATKHRIHPDFFQKHSVQELSQWSDYLLGKRGRLTSPLILKEGKNHYEPIEWADAFQLMSDTLRNLDHPDEAIFYTSGRTSNEAAFLYQLFVRKLGTNNLPDCSNMCHESSGVALTETLGIGKGSVTLEDFYQTDLILVIGQNPGTNHPRMLSALQKAKKNGAKIITINPLQEAGLVNFKHPQKIGDMLGNGTNLTDLYLQVGINGDVALLKAIMKLLLKAERAHQHVFDHEFIHKHTDGYEEFIEKLDAYQLEELIKSSGIPLKQVQAAVDLIKNRKKIIVCWAMGLTQHKNGVENIREVVNLLLLKGSIGKPGAGTCPVRGHSNVQGDRTMGIWESPKVAFLDRLKAVFHFEPPRKHGLNTVQAIQAMANRKAKVFLALGGNFLSATPDTHLTATALQHCDLTVQVSTKLNRSHLITGKTALILPCLGRTEIDQQSTGSQFVSVENSMGVVHTSQGHLSPASPKLKSEVAIICGLAKSFFYKEAELWTTFENNYDTIRDAIEKCIDGFENYNERVKKPGGFYLPNCARAGNFNTLNKKANFTINSVPQHRLKTGEYLMMTIRSHDQFNTTIYGLDDRYRGIYQGRRIVLVNEHDLQKANLKTGDFVDLFTKYAGTKRVVEKFMVVKYNIPPKCIATYFPETNPLIPVDAYAERSETPISKSVVVRMEKKL